MKIGAIIQARMGSTRLPGKVMKRIEDRTVLEHVILRVNQSKLIDDIIIATTENENDMPIVMEALRCGVQVFKGSEDDVLLRYYCAAKENQLDVVVRITSDCPLVDPKVLDEIIAFYIVNKYSIVSNAGPDSSSRTYPRGLDIEVFSFEKLQEANENADEKYQREHVTPYIYETENQVYFFKNDVDYSKYRLTLDTIEDLELLTKVYHYLYHGEHNFYLKEIIALFERCSDLNMINAQVEQKKLRE